MFDYEWYINYLINKIDSIIKECDSFNNVKRHEYTKIRNSVYKKKISPKSSPTVESMDKNDFDNLPDWDLV